MSQFTDYANAAPSAQEWQEAEERADARSEAHENGEVANHYDGQGNWYRTHRLNAATRREIEAASATNAQAEEAARTGELVEHIYTPAPQVISPPQAKPKRQARAKRLPPPVATTPDPEQLTPVEAAAAAMRETFGLGESLDALWSADRRHWEAHRAALAAKEARR